jgi:CHASE2 domain-containing sensor protein
MLKIRMKAFIKYILPLFIALTALLLYIVIYNPAGKSEDFTTAQLVFFAVLGFSAIILFPGKESKLLLWIYVSISLLIPALFLFFVKIWQVNIPFHPLILGLMAVGFTYGILFTAGYMRQKK